MNPFEMAFGIVLVIAIAGVLRAKYGVGRDKHGNDYSLRDDATAAENKQLREDIRGLKDRIAVLERVITDTNTSSNLDREIEQLRNIDR